MNYTAKAISEPRVLRAGNVAVASENLKLSLPRSPILVLLFITLLSAIALLYVKDLNRRLFVDYQKLEQNYAQLQAEEGKLLWDQSSLASYTKIQGVAESYLNMQVPLSKDIVTLQDNT